MFKLKKTEILASEIAEFLNLELVGRDFYIREPATPNNFSSNSLFFLESLMPLDDLNKKDAKEVLIIIYDEVFNTNPDFSVIRSANPQIDFIKIVNEFFIDSSPARIAASAKIDPTVKLGRNVSIGENVVIAPDVIIGDNTIILNNVVINSQVEIGHNCLIKDNATIGSYGYNFICDTNGNPINYINIGKITIGNYVWIGANSAIESASFEKTIISDYVKIDDLVQIGYNTIIHPRCLITAGVIVSHSVIIEEDVQISPNVSIRENIRIGKNSKIGLGAVVIKNLEGNATYVGNPAYLLNVKE